jgi:hypothetical protein
MRLKLKLYPYNGLGHLPFMTGILNGTYQANLIFLPPASFVVSLFNPIIGLIWFGGWVVAMMIFNWNWDQNEKR